MQHTGGLHEGPLGFLLTPNGEVTEEKHIPWETNNVHSGAGEKGCSAPANTTPKWNPLVLQITPQASSIQ